MLKVKKNSEEDIINEIIEKGIEIKARNKIPEHLIVNKDTYNPNHKRLMSMAG